MHAVSTVVWLGGLIFQGAVMMPVVEEENAYVQAAAKKIIKRFVGFVWMSVWTMLATGVIMMLLNPHFIWFRYDNYWSKLLALKELIFILMAFYAFGYARMLQYLSGPSSNGGFDEGAELYRKRIDQFRKISILLGITALLISAAMRSYV